VAEALGEVDGVVLRGDVARQGEGAGFEEGGLEGVEETAEVGGAGLCCRCG